MKYIITYIIVLTLISLTLVLQYHGNLKVRWESSPLFPDIL